MDTVSDIAHVFPDLLSKTACDPVPDQFLSFIWDQVTGIEITALKDGVPALQKAASASTGQ